jgi:hypothetical protein
MYAYAQRGRYKKGRAAQNSWCVEKPAWVLHVSKEPFHCGLRIAVPRREQRFLAADRRKTHRFELGERYLVEFGLSY